MKTFSYLILTGLLGSASAFGALCPNGSTLVVQPFIITNSSPYIMNSDGYSANKSTDFLAVDQPPHITNGGYQEAGSFSICCNNSSTQDTLTLKYDFVEANNKLYTTDLNFKIVGCSVQPSVSSCAPGVSCPAPEAGSTIEFTFNS